MHYPLHTGTSLHEEGGQSSDTGYLERNGYTYGSGKGSGECARAISLPTSKPAAKKRRRSSDSSDEEQSDDDDDGDEDDAMSCDDGEDSEHEGDESEDESDCEENMWNVKQIVGERKKGKTLEYQVEWEGEEWAGQYTWEPAAAMWKTISR